MQEEDKDSIKDSKINNENTAKIKQDNFSRVIIKEGFDKIGFGFGSQQFINILFWQTGAGLFLVGIINVLRVIFGNIIYYFIEKKSSIFRRKSIISAGGIVFGFSFLLIAFSIFIKSVLLFSISIIIGSISIVFYGESRILTKFNDAKKLIYSSFTKWGLIITAICLFLSAFILDKYPISGKNVFFQFFNNFFSIKVFGYLIVFEIAAVAFILAGYFLLNIKKEDKKKSVIIKEDTNLSMIFKNKLILIIILINIILSCAQTIGYAYYGIHIYNNFNNVFFGGFLNVAMVFLISVFTSLIGYFITRLNSRSYKKFSILIAGSFMTMALPLAYFLNLDLTMITMATIIGIIGSSTIGVTNSLIVIELINHELRQSYFLINNILSIPVFLILGPVLSLAAHIYSMSMLFLALTVIIFFCSIALIISSVIFKNEIV